MHARLDVLVAAIVGAMLGARARSSRRHHPRRETFRAPADVILARGLR